MSISMFRRRLRPVGLLLLSLALAACASAPASAPPTPQIVRETVEVTAAPVVVRETVEVPVDTPADPGRLVVYSGRSEALVGPIIAQYAEATGIDVEVRYGSTSEIAATLLEEGSDSPADIFFAQDPGGLGAVADAGLFAPLPDEILTQVPSRFRSLDRLWVGVSGRARVVVYNTATVQPEDLPSDIYDFIDPKWSGRIGWAPTNGSLHAMITAMRAEWGDKRTREWLEGIQANDPVVFEGNAPIVEAAASGEISVGFVNHYYLYRFLREQGESFQARNAFLTGGGPGSLIMVAGAGRLAGGKNEANALRFLRFMLSPVAQQYFAGQTYEYPVVEGVVTPAGLPPLSDLEPTALDMDMADLSDLQGTLELMRDTGILP